MRSNHALAALFPTNTINADRASLLFGLCILASVSWAATPQYHEERQRASPAQESRFVPIHAEGSRQLVDRPDLFVYLDAQAAPLSVITTLEIV
jgi:hypothetical protein